MAEEVRADPVKLCTLADEVTGFAGDLRDGLATARQAIVIPASAFGNSDGAGTLDDTYVDVIEDAGAGVEDIAGVLEGDVDRLYRIAFSYKATDEANSANINNGGGNLPV
ncbi:hypothetical protein [Stackebrandtia soli]|uniref:hypothetical protein n=1 Tax=Stackebrandtia soli TaxID=1892856 RepID=UPI0039EB2FB0